MSQRPVLRSGEHQVTIEQKGQKPIPNVRILLYTDGAPLPKWDGEFVLTLPDFIAQEEADIEIRFPDGTWLPIVVVLIRGQHHQFAGAGDLMPPNAKSAE